MTGRRWKAELEAALPELKKTGGTYAEDYGRTISFFVHVYPATRDVRFRALAEGVAREAIDLRGSRGRRIQRRTRHMLYSGKTIVGRIKGHIKKKGGAYSASVVGISKEPRGSMFIQHGVRKVGDFWILMHAETHKVARGVRLFLTKKLSLTRGSAPDDPAADFVHAYRKSANTKP